MNEITKSQFRLLQGDQKGIGYSFDDVLLSPKLGIVDSRSDVDLASFLTKKLSIKIPIVSAPMSTVTEGELAWNLSKEGGAAFIHRHMGFENQDFEWNHIALSAPMIDDGPVGCAIGIEPKRFKFLYERGCRLFCLDVAHAHSRPVLKFLQNLPRDIDLIVGSVATREAVEDFLHFNEDIIGAFRVGIGPGAACTTRETTGFGVPQLLAIAECAYAAGDVPIIADGGIKNSGDIVKALAAGASSVMLGRLLAGAKEAPRPGEYMGEASELAQKIRNGEDIVIPSHQVNSIIRHIEGVSGTIPIEGTVKEIIDKLMAGVRSGISYGGGRNIRELQENAEFIPVAHSVHIESGVRI